MNVEGSALLTVPRLTEFEQRSADPLTAMLA